MERIIEIKRPRKSTVTLKNEWIRIQRYGAFQKMKGEKTIPLKSIASVQFRKAKLGVNGMIRFSIIGNNSVYGAISDDNTIMFVTKDNSEMEGLKNYIENYIILSSGETVISTTQSPVQEVKELKELLDMNIITQEEFENKKKSLLDL